MRSREIDNMQWFLTHTPTLAKYGLQNITPEEAQQRLSHLDEIEKEAAVRLAVRRAARDQEEYAKLLNDF